MSSESYHQIFPDSSLTLKSVKEKAPARVLVVDDDDFNFSLFEFTLRELQLTCEFAISGEQALEKVRIRND